MSVIFLFIDGVGLGADMDVNPFHNTKYPAFLEMSGGQPFTESAKSVQKDNFLFKPLDATLGVEGLPQSGTGQAALFTGQNTAALIGKHFGPFPHSGIKHLLREQSLFTEAQRRNKKAAFVNGYPDIFFEKSRQRNRWSCTTLMTKSAGLPLRGLREVQDRKAITAGLTQQSWKRNLNLPVPEITPEKAASRLLALSSEKDLVLHEFYLTDKAGHSRDKEQAARFLHRYDRFLGEIIQQKNPQDTLILSSDHGNIEDLSTKTHTFYPVPLFVKGPGAEFFQQATSIMDIMPGILNIL